MKQKSNNRHFIAFALALTGVVFFSAKSVMVKIAYHYGVDALSMLTLRMVFSAPVYLAVIISSTNKRERNKHSKSDYFKLILLGVLGYYLASLLDFSGLYYVSAGLERLILFVYPTLVLLLSSVFLKKKSTLGQKIAVFTTYFGVMVAFYQNTETRGANLWMGGLLIFGSALSYAAYLVGSGTLLPKFGTKLFTSYSMIVSTIAVIIHFTLTHGTNIFGFPKEVYFLGIAMAIICTVIPSFLISEAIRQWSPSNVAIVGSIGPVSTILLAGIFLNEKITVFQLVGTLIVISGILLLSKGKKFDAPQKIESTESINKIIV